MKKLKFKNHKNYFLEINLLPILPLITATIWFTFQGISFAQSERINVLEGKTTSFEFEFEIEDFQISDPSVINVSYIPTSGIRITGIKRGHSFIEVYGKEKTRQFSTLEISVIANLEAISSAIKRMLEVKTPAVEVIILNDQVLVQGTVTNFLEKEYIKKVCKQFGAVDFSDLAWPTAEEIICIKESLKNRNILIQEGSNAINSIIPGQVALAVDQRGISVFGNLFSDYQAQEVKQVVNRCLKLPNAEEDGMVSFNLDILSTAIQVDVAFVRVSDDEYREIGVNLAEQGLVAIQGTGSAIGSWIRGSGGDDRFSSSYIIQSDMVGSLRAFSDGGAGQSINVGSIIFRNDSNEFVNLHIGGTIVIPVQGPFEGTASVEEVDWGLVLKTKGTLRDQETADLQLELDLSVPTGISRGGNFELSRNSVQVPVICPLGKTLVVGASSSFTESLGQSGVPLLKDIPVLNWLFSVEKRGKSKSRLLILVSPQIAGPDIQRPQILEQNHNKIIEETSDSF